MARAHAPTIHFVSLGCVKNRVDSEVMLGVAAGEGFRLVDDASEAAVIVVNTCGFVGEAKRESIDTIIELAELKTRGACKKLVVTGCLAQRYSGELAEAMPEVDHFLGSSDMLKLADVLGGKAERMLVGHPEGWVLRASDPRIRTQHRASAYVKIAEGCNRTCSFCVIPALRGKQRSRPIDDVVREAEALVESGAIELNLVSQDTIAYGRDLPKVGKNTLAALVQRVAEVPGVRWVRLLYLYPEPLDPALVELLAGHPRVVRYVDMPLQHASDAMLSRMRRGHGKDRQRAVVDELRRAVPDVTLRTAFIVGHPGESEADFEELCDFVSWARADHVAAFRYSDEESTVSHAQDAKVLPLVAANRYRKLLAIQRRIAREKNKARIGRELDVLVEGPSEEHEFVMVGRHAGQAPEIDGQVFLSEGEAHAGELRRVRISQASDYDLVGDLLDQAPPQAKSPAKKPRRGLPVLGSTGRYQ